MNFYTAEKLQFFLYAGVISFSIIDCITSAIAWNHWKYVLDACEINCGCFLYGVSLYSTTRFQGGHIAYCYYATFAPIIPFIFAIIFGCYHGYRVCMGSGKRKSASTSIRQREGDVIVVTAQSDLSDSDISTKYWIITSVIACFLALYTLVYASIYSDGYSWSCSEYRREVIKTLQTNGDALHVIKNRLTCGSIFDFMDYLHKDTIRNFARNDHINTALCFYFALIAGWLSVFSWLSIAGINILLARRSRESVV